ncbi:hypothetical protein [Flammeovirga aprica]|uniref:DUF6311 domain-containing protein n=1 Tax=Flammeovirga aprica JL-4 TaxID=694437 RepID=A0A7X9RRY4_9BACT|nr:hypothetical protein [Flammeovirga aprica]NME66391.1 hypothetical protein [Flammeovirga aprica JL-4]
MKETINKQTHFSTGLLTLSCVLFFLLQKIITSPNHFLLFKGGDALKNYFLYAFVSKYGNLENINFPFGESILYTDSVVLLSSINHFISKYFVDISDYSIGILHLEMLAVFFIGYTYSYKIFRVYKIDRTTAVLSSLLLTLGTPSNSRILLHFGLVFIGLMPCLVYYIITFKNKKRQNSLIIFLINIGGYFLHGYVGTLFSGLTIFYFITESILNKNKHFIYSALGIIPTLIFTSAVYFTDTNLWRSQRPSGLFDYIINLDRISPFTLRDEVSIHESLLFNFWFYSLVLLAFIYFKKVKLKPALPFFIVGFIFIVYGTSVFLRFSFVLELLPELQQLRDLQRFGWVSYFIISVGVIRVSYTFLNKKILLTILCLGLLESIYFMAKVEGEIQYDKNVFNLQLYDFEDQINTNLTSSIIIHADTTVHLDQLADLQYQLAYKFGISPINNYLSRPSLEERNIQKQFTIPFIKPKKPSILNYINPDEEVIILGDTLKEQYKPTQIFNHAVYSCKLNKLIPQPVSLDSIRDNALYVDSLSQNSLYHIRNEIKKGWTVDAFFKGKIASIPMDILDTTKVYQLNIWLYHFHQDSLIFDKLVLYQGTKRISGIEHLNEYDVLSEKRGRLSMNFKIPNHSRDSLYLFAERSFKQSPFIIDRLSEKINAQKRRKQPLVFNELTISEIPSKKKKKVIVTQDK